jgi:RNA polymerase III RPC4
MSAQDSKRSALSGGAAGGNRVQSMFEDDAAIISSSFSIPDFYDSDSSDEGRKRTSASRRDAHVKMTLQPAQLPFPDARVPVGIGPVSTRPSLYCDVSSEEDLLKVFSMSSPFANRTLSEVSRRDEDANPWFLVQLPTRLPLETGQVAANGSILPPTIISSDDNVMPATSSDINNNNGEESMIGGALSDFVSVPPLLENAFDNVLTSTTASSGGKLGRISVYKSGKTIFTMGDTQFLVSEGLPCGFSQQAALLEVEDANYIPLGSIGKTIVVTPNVKEAFST